MPHLPERPSRRTRNGRRGGFTLLETSIVLLLFSFVVLGYANLVRSRMAEQQVSLAASYINTTLDAALHYYNLRNNEALQGSWTPPPCSDRSGGSGANEDFWPQSVAQLEATQLLDRARSDLTRTLAPVWESTNCRLLTLRVLIKERSLAATLAARLPSGRFSASAAGFLLRVSLSPPGHQALLSNFYLLDGSRPLAGNLQAASHDILNVGLLQGEAVRIRQIIHLSDQRTKQHPEPLPAATIAALDDLRPYRFHWRTAGAAAPTAIGLIAQQTAAVLPELVHEYQGLQGIDYGALQTLMLARLQEQQKRLQALEQICGE